MLAVSDGTRDAFVKLEVVAALLFRSENRFSEKCGLETRNAPTDPPWPLKPPLGVVPGNMIKRSFSLLRNHQIFPN